MRFRILISIFVVMTVYTPGWSQYLWQKQGDAPVLLNGANGAWDDYYVFAPCVIRVGDSLYMWYNGSEGYDVPNTPYRIGLAVSSDGVIWTKYAANPIIDAASDTWRNRAVRSPQVLLEDGVYKMWLTGAQWDPSLPIGWDNPVPWHIGYMSSTDGIVWSEPVENPILEPSPAHSWSSVQLMTGSILHDSTGYRMWYNGTSTHWWDSQWSNWAIGYATSPDEVSWTVYEGNPVLSVGPSYNYETILVNSVTQLDSTYYMWYSQKFSGQFQVCLATSSNGVDWVPYAGNPVVSSGASDEWDAGSITWPAVLVDGPIHHMYYQSGNADWAPTTKIGLARSLTGLRSLTAETGYFAPGTDSVTVLVHFTGNTDSLDLLAEIEDSADSTMVSAALLDDGVHGDGEADDGYFGALLPVPDDEGAFGFGLSAWQAGEQLINYDNLGSTFTTAGPIRIIAVEPFQASQPIPGGTFAFYLLLTNQGETASVPDVEVYLSMEESAPAHFSGSALRPFAGIAAGDSATNLIPFQLSIHEDCPADTALRIQAAIYSSDVLCWEDSVDLLIQPSTYAEPMGLPTDFQLFQNHPNPFNPTTTIQYSMPVAGLIKLTIFDIRGQEITTLQKVTNPAGTYSVQWNSTDASGNPVSTGVYFCRLQAGEYSKTIKMVYLR